MDSKLAVGQSNLHLFKLVQQGNTIDALPAVTCALLCVLFFVRVEDRGVHIHTSLQGFVGSTTYTIPEVLTANRLHQLLHFLLVVIPGKARESVWEFQGNLGLNFDLCGESMALESGNTGLNLDLLCVAQNGVVLELRRIAASQNCHSC